MNQTERLNYLILGLLNEQPQYRSTQIPAGILEKKDLLRALFNLRPPDPISKEILDVQDEYLQHEIGSMGVADLKNLSPISKNIYLWQGDITTLKVDAIVNAANDQLLGCFVPGHHCIDNAIHTYAGIQLRLACNDIMQGQGRPEQTGSAKITSAFNLPSTYVLHTVGPVVSGELTQESCDQLASCYCSCLGLAAQNGLSSVAFCCISTSEFCFPADRAAEIAIQTVRQFLEENRSEIKVVFNVFKESDYDLYKKLL